MKSIDARITDFYAEYDEASRLHATAVGRLEFERTRELLRRHLPAAPARVLDVGGGRVRMPAGSPRTAMRCCS